MGILNAFNIGREGLSVHGKRVEIAAKNIANIAVANKRVVPKSLPQITNPRINEISNNGNHICVKSFLYEHTSRKWSETTLAPKSARTTFAISDG